MKFGVQLYGPLSCMQGDDEENHALEHLRCLAGAGITQVEPCVNVGCYMPEAVVWEIDWLMEHWGEIREMGLEIFSIHPLGSELLQETERLVELAKLLGLRQYVVKTPLDCPLQQAALNYMKLADRLAEDSVALLLHNEFQDIQIKVGGKTAYERLLDLCMDKVGAQVDVGWVQAGGENPLEFLRRNAWRVKSLHHKDFHGGAEPSEAPIGTGTVDLAACFRFAQHRNIPQLIDQEHFGADVPGELCEISRKLNGWVYDRSTTVSYLNIYDTETGQVQTVAGFDRVIEAPNWLKKSDTILFNSEGHMYRYDLPTGAELLLDTGICDQCNNDHVVSPDEKYIAVSHNDEAGGYASRIYLVPITVEALPQPKHTEGGATFSFPISGSPEPCRTRLVTPQSPSYLHGWSPDGKELAYCAFREIDGRQEVDVYTIPVEGGTERRLTGGGFNDGPEYSPDGKHIWYNSTRSGLMQIWRMDRDGKNQTQITKNERNNWFGHLSPDGTKVVYLSYGPEQLEAHEHLPNMPVELWLMDADGKNQRKILSLFGGQGSINVNSWAGDGRRFAFVSYEVL